MSSPLLPASGAQIQAPLSPSHANQSNKHSYQCSFSLNSGSDAINSNQKKQLSSQRRHLISKLGHSQKEPNEERKQSQRKPSSQDRCNQRIESSIRDEASRLGHGDGLDKATLMKKQRVSANSKVNFCFLSEEEQVERYKNTRIEYFELKKKLAEQEHNYYKRFQKLQNTKPLPKEKKSKQSLALIEAKEKLKLQSFEELPDCGNILENLAECLATGAMSPDSVEFGLLCNLIRKVKMRISSKEGLCLLTKGNAFLQQSTHKDLIQFIQGVPPEKVSPRKPQPIYYSSPLLRAPLIRNGFMYVGQPLQGKMTPLNASVSGSKVKIVQRD